VNTWLFYTFTQHVGARNRCFMSTNRPKEFIRPQVTRQGYDDFLKLISKQRSYVAFIFRQKQWCFHIENLRSYRGQQRYNWAQASGESFGQTQEIEAWQYVGWKISHIKSRGPEAVGRTKPELPVLRHKLGNPPPPWFWGSNKKQTAGFEDKPGETVATSFEAKLEKTVAAGFEANPLETVVTGSEAKLVKTV
jgi:hypothetical protein